MLRTRFLASALAVTGTLAVVPPAAAQAPAQPYQPQMAPAPTPDADALADAMRQLAGDPRDLTALITAGELSLKVGDASGAAALFKRAEQVDPMNGRVKAGMARILVTQERPGEALRYFDQAVGYGLDPRTFAGDRGLAYDLIGEQERAQRDYRSALKAADNDEVRRRYALSLAISGKQLGAFEQLEPLIRRNDRGAWRARAFVLALTGDVPGANRIAQTMMPAGLAQGLAPFFSRLPALTPIDKAFAVHFGEVSATPQRLVDARLTPILVALGPDPDARPTAIVVPSPPPQAPRGRRGRPRRGEPARVEVASAAPRVSVPAPGFGAAGQSPTDPVRTPPVRTPPVRMGGAAPATGSTLPPAVSVAAAPRSAPAPVRFARADVDPIQKATLADYAQIERYNQALAQRRERATQRPAAAPAAIDGARVAAARTTPPSVPVPAPAAPATLDFNRAAPPPVAVAAVPPASLPVISPATQFAAAGTQVAAPSASPVTQRAAGAATSPAPEAGPMPTPVAATAQVAAGASSSTPTSLAANEDAILARIVHGVTIPGAELGVAPPPPRFAPAPAPAMAVAVAANVDPPPAAPSPEPKPIAREPVAASAAAKPPVVVATRTSTRRAASGDAAPTRSKPKPVELADAAPTKRGARTRDATADEPPSTTTRPGRRGAATRTVAPDETDAPPTRTRSGKRTAADIRAAAKDDADTATPTRGKRGDRRALAAKDDDAPAAKGKARTASSRKDDADRKTAPAESARIWVQVAGGANESDLPKAWSAVQSRTPALKGKQAYSTPLRATNRVVTGPFKTDAEARAFVNQLARQGVSAFPFTSDKGQKMAKLPPR